MAHYGLKFNIPRYVVEDCLQELFLQLWQNREHIQETHSVKHYLFKSLRNHIISHLRAEKWHQFTDLDWEESPLTDGSHAEALLIEEEAMRSLEAAIKSQLEALPPREREALYLRYYENLSVGEIAEVMNVNYQSVANFFQKALRKLRARWFVPALIALFKYL